MMKTKRRKKITLIEVGGVVEVVVVVVAPARHQIRMRMRMHQEMGLMLVHPSLALLPHQHLTDLRHQLAGVALDRQDTVLLQVKAVRSRH